MGILLIIIAIMIGPILTRPFRAMWSWFNGLMLIGGACWLRTPRIPLSSGSMADAFAIWLILILVGTTIISLTLCILIHWLSDKPWHDPIPSHPFQKLVHAGNGLALAIITFVIYDGMIGPDTFISGAHLLLLGLAIMLIPLAVFGELALIYSWSTAFGLIILTIISATYPAKVLKSARDAADGAPFCIYLNQSQRFVSGYRDLTLIGFDRGSWTAHAILVIGEGDATHYGNWSYRQGQFMVPWDLWTPQPDLHCPPTDH